MTASLREEAPEFAVDRVHLRLDGLADTSNSHGDLGERQMRAQQLQQAQLCGDQRRRCQGGRTALFRQLSPDASRLPVVAGERSQSPYCASTWKPAASRNVPSTCGSRKRRAAPADEHSGERLPRDDHLVPGRQRGQPARRRGRRHAAVGRRPTSRSRAARSGAMHNSTRPWLIRKPKLVTCIGPENFSKNAASFQITSVG